MRKPRLNYAVKKTFSLPEALYNLAEMNMQAKRFPTFSDYLQHLIRNDVQPNETVTMQRAMQAALQATR